MTQTKRNLLIAILAIAAAGIGIAVALVVVDVHEDRQYQVRITGNTKLYNSESPSPDKRGVEGVIQILQPGDEVRVLRILRGSDYDAIRVELKDGRIGYIFLGDNFELSR
jgi:hypothetical protein